MLPLIGLDTETALIGQGRKAPPLVCYTVAEHGRSGELYRWDDKRRLFELWNGAAAGRWILVLQNAPFDAAVCAAQYPELFPTIFEAYRRGCVSDVMIREILLDIEEGGRPYRSSLDKLARKYLNRPMEKGEDTWRLRYWDLRETPIRDWPESARTYAVTDAEILLPIYRAQDRAKGHDDTFADEAAQCCAHFALHLMASWGLKTDVEHVDDLIQQFETVNEERREFLRGYGVARKNGSIDTKFFAQWIEDGGTKLPRTDTGKPSLAKENLEVIDDPIVQTYLDLKADQKNVKTYLRKYESGLVQCSVNPILANGRNALSKPSLQNLPRSGPIRESFIPRAGRLLCSIDYDGVELRTLAQACLTLVGTSKLAKTFQKDPNADPHTIFAAGLLGVSESEAFALKKAKDPKLKGARQRAKAANFGFPGGMGYDRFIVAQKKQGATYTLPEAKQLKKDFLRMWPEMRQYFNFVASEIPDAVGHTTMKTLVSGRYRGKVNFAMLANGYFSSLMADGAKAATFEVARQCYADPGSPIYGARIVNSVHDELLMEFDEAGAHEQSHYTAQIFCDIMMNNYTPDIPITAAPALMRRWYKGAEPAYKNGRLVPWEPSK